MIFGVLYGICWAVYLGSLTYIILFKGSWDETYQFLQIIGSGNFPERRKVYLRPFESTCLFLENWEYSYARWNIFGNMLLFLPFGILMRLAWRGRKGIALTAALAFSFSIGFETIQFLYAIGEFDVDDVILNVVGAVVGYGVVSLGERCRKSFLCIG